MLVMGTANFFSILFWLISKLTQIQRYQLLKLISQSLCTMKVTAKDKTEKQPRQKRVTSLGKKAHAHMLTVLEENILRISLVLLLNMCGITKFNSDMSSSRLFCTGVPVSSKRLFAWKYT
jgi:hypothetical protein